MYIDVEENVTSILFSLYCFDKIANIICPRRYYHAYHLGFNSDIVATVTEIKQDYCDVTACVYVDKEEAGDHTDVESELSKQPTTPPSSTKATG